MKKFFIRVYFIFVFIVWCFVVYLLVEYIYLRISFENIYREIREYQDIPYLNRKLSLLELEYKKVSDLERENRIPGIVLSKIVGIFNKYGVKVNYILRESYEESGEIYKASVRGEFKKVFISFGEIEGLFLPVRFSKIYMSGDSENVNMVFYFDLME